MGHDRKEQDWDYYHFVLVEKKKKEPKWRYSILQGFTHLKMERVAKFRTWIQVFWLQIVCSVQDTILLLTIINLTPTEVLNAKRTSGKGCHHDKDIMVKVGNSSSKGKIWMSEQWGSHLQRNKTIRLPMNTSPLLGDNENSSNFRGKRIST